MKIGKLIVFGIVILGLSACDKDAEAHTTGAPHSHGDEVAHTTGAPHSHGDKVTHTTGAPHSHCDRISVKDSKNSKTKCSKG